MAFNRYHIAALAACLAVICVPWTADGYETGAPVLTCRTMIPGHGEAAQTSAAPYRIVPSENVTSSRIRITLTAPKVNDYFIGFLIEARVPGSGENAVGSFVQVPQDSQTLDCNDVPVSTYTLSSQELSAKDNNNYGDLTKFSYIYCI